MMLKLKLQYFGHLMWRVDSLEKTDAGRDWGQEEKGMTEDGMAGWHHWLDGHEFEWTPGVGDGQGGLACCKSWGCKGSDATERLNWTELNTHEETGIDSGLGICLQLYARKWQERGFPPGRLAPEPLNSLGVPCVVYLPRSSCYWDSFLCCLIPRRQRRRETKAVGSFLCSVA